MTASVTSKLHRYAFTLSFGLAAGLLASTAHAASTSCTAILVPAYFDNASEWQSVIASPAKQVVIMNPENGPGARKDSTYVSWISAAKSNGITVLGYIPTGNGKTALSTITTQAQHYSQWYGVTDFFLDETSANAKNLSKYQSITSALDSAYGNPFLMFNPGTVPAQGYFGMGENTEIVVFEDKASAFSTSLFPSWLAAYYSRSAIIIYDASTTQLASVFSFASSNGFASFYATDFGTNANPYGGLPSYWSAESQDGVCSH